jgi:hypothetical protein
MFLQKPKAPKKEAKLMSNRSKFSVIFMLGLCAVPASAAYAQDDILNEPAGPCEMELTLDNSVDWRGPYGRGYEVFSEERSFEGFNLSVRKQGAACEFFLTASNLTGSQNQLEGPQGSLAFDILKSTSGPSFLSSELQGTQLSRIEGRFGSGNAAYSQTFFVDIPTGQFVRGGKYSGQAVVRLFRQSGNGPELVDEALIAVLAPVASALRVNSDIFPGSLREASIDFGDLSGSKQQSIDFAIVSNADIAVKFQSANNGKLAHHAGAPGIKYSLKMQGQEMNLDGASATHRLGSSNSNLAANVPVEVSIAAPNGTPAAGRYNDTLTITFTAD